MHPVKWSAQVRMPVFICFERKNNSSETIQEEYNWAYGAEVADSIGAEVFTTSLGYTTFDNNRAIILMSDLNGNKTPITIAANIAARKGLLF
jgi:serine protease AprX